MRAFAKLYFRSCSVNAKKNKTQKTSDLLVLHDGNFLFYRKIISCYEKSAIVLPKSVENFMTL